MHIRGVQVYDSRVVEEAEAIDILRPLIVSFRPESLKFKGVERLRKALERFYPPSHACWMFGPPYDLDPAGLPIADIARLFPEIPGVMMLYVPPGRRSNGHA